MVEVSGKAVADRMRAAIEAQGRVVEAAKAAAEAARQPAPPAPQAPGPSVQPKG